jgi:PAS domain S-box-containing protein
MEVPVQRPPAWSPELAAQVPGAVIAVDLDGRITHWSEGAELLYGWTAEEALGQSVRELILVGQEHRADEVKAATHAGASWSGEFPARHKDGRSIVVSVSNAPLRDATGAVVGVVGVSLDISAHVAAVAARAAELQAAQHRAERLADRNGRLARVSDALGRALTPSQVVDVVLTQGVEALGADAGGIAVIEGDRLHVLGTIGYEDDVVRTYEGLPLDAITPVTDVLRTGTVTRTESYDELVSRYPDLPHSSLSDSFVSVPLEVDGRLVGVMALSAARPGAFPAEDLDFLVTLCRQCAQALERGRLFAAERDARRRTAFLAMASARLAESLDYHRTIDAVAQLAVPAAGDWCSVHLLDEPGRPQLVTVHHKDPDRQELLVELFERYPPDPERGSGIGQAIGERRTVVHRHFPEAVLEAIARDAWHLDALRRLGLGSALVVPLQVVGRVIGVLTVTSDEPDRYSDTDVQLVEDLARRMATAVDNAVRYRQQRENALTLQRSLLPRALPTLPGLHVAHRYLPGTAGAEVGGDWYDLLALRGGRVALVIGDVMGRGVAAAAVMGQVRATVRACALVEESPAAVLALVDAAMSSLGQTSLTTCLYGVLDPRTRRLRIASAGHLPPLLVHRDGGAEYVELDPAPPLGVAGDRPTEVEVELPDEVVLLLFTDGLVEGRQQPVEEGLHALRAAVSAPREVPSDVEGLCEQVLRATGRDGRHDDDSALLALWTGSGGTAADEDVHLHLAGHLSEVARARHLTVEVARRVGVDVDDAALLVTELATNALRHGGPGVDLWLRPTAGGLRVELVDGRPAGLPRAALPAPEAEGGRGLAIVSALAHSWGSERLAVGKRVWFELGAVAGR